MPKTSPTAHFDTAAEAVVIEELAISDRDVIHEAQRWTTGERGPIVEDSAELAAADLSLFVTEAIRIGSHALSVTGQAQEARALEQMLKDVGDKTADATSKAAEVADRAMREASDTVMKAAGDAKKAITEAERQSRTEFTTAVTAAKTDLNAEVRRIFAGESPTARAPAAADKFGTSPDQRVRWHRGTAHQSGPAVRPRRPHWPMAKQSVALASAAGATQRAQKNHAELTGKVEISPTVGPGGADRHGEGVAPQGRLLREPDPRPDDVRGRRARGRVLQHHHDGGSDPQKQEG
jgi:hypothetical protein